MASLGVLSPLLDLWHSLSQGARDNVVGTIVGGLALAVVTGSLIFFRKSIWAVIDRIRPNPGATAQTPQSATKPQELIIKVERPEPSAPAPQIPEPEEQIERAFGTVPRPPTVGFVARRDKDGRDIVERLTEEMAPDKSLLTVLWGEGGIGKTTLAAEVARGLRIEYNQRIVWTSADKRSDFTFSTFLDEIALRLNRNDLLRLAVEPKATEVQILIAGAPMLVVLDNFETISPDEATSCSNFLADKASCSGLITTRHQVAGARNVRIDAMSLDEGKEFLKRLIEQSADPSAFVGLDRERLMETAALNPLVMEWVVAQIALAQRPADVLEDLSHGKGDAAQRVFDRSFNLPQLGDDGRTVLLALSLFVPSASRGALAAVAGFGDDKNRLNQAVKQLASLRLVTTVDGGERLLVQGLTRELARARLEKY